MSKPMARILQSCKTIRTPNNSFIGSLSFQKLRELKLELPVFPPIKRNKFHSIDKNKMDNIAKYHLKDFKDKNEITNVTGLLTLNCTHENVYLIDGVHRYKAYMWLLEQPEIDDFNINVETYNVKTVEDVIDNYNKIHNFKNKPVKRKRLPLKLRYDVWDRYNGSDNAKAKCYCCRKTIIEKTNFTCGHVESRSMGGSDSIDNLRPICHSCNQSMGRMNMETYVKKYYPDNLYYFIHEIPDIKYLYNPIPII